MYHMKNIIIFLCILLLCVTQCTVQGYPEIWSTRWTILCFFSVLYFGYKVGKKFHWSCGLAFTWAMLSCIYTSIYRINYFFEMMPVTDYVTYIQNSLMSGLCLLIVIIFFYHIPKNIINIFIESIAIIGLLDSVYVVIQLISGGNITSDSGFFHEPSMDGIFIAVTYPLLIFKNRFNINNFKKLNILLYLFTFIIPIIAIIVTKSSIPVGVLAVVFSSFIIFKVNIKTINKILISSFVFILIIALGYLYTGPNIFSDSMRFMAYKLFLHYFFELFNLHIAIGTGTGTFAYWGPMIQQINSFLKGQYFVWAHNDWLQLMIENGIIGIVIYLNMAYWVLNMAIKSKKIYLITSFLAYMAAMCFNYPLHMATHAFLGCLIVRAIIDAYHARNEFQI